MPENVKDLTELLRLSKKVPSEDSVANVMRDSSCCYLGSSNLVTLSAHSSAGHWHEFDQELPSDTPGRPSAASFAARVLLLGRQTCKTQTIVYNGISGSGKTLTRQSITDCFIQATPDAAKAQQLQATLAVLASLTTAKNSSSGISASQCASLLEMQFSPTATLISGKVLPFEFNKQRLLHFSGDQRGFSIFYEILAGATLREREEWGLKDLPSDYALLSKTSSALGSSNIDNEETKGRDRKGFALFRQALVVLQLNPRAVSSVFRLISVILVLHNVSFEVTMEGQAQISAESQTDLDIAAALLYMSVDDLEHHLMNKTRFVKKDLISFLLDANGCAAQRDQFCQTLYALLLVCLVDTANMTFSLPESEIVSNQAAGGFGILQLDLPGFIGRTARWSGDRGSTLLQGIQHDGFGELRINFAQEMVAHWHAVRLFEEDRNVVALAKSEGVSFAPVQFIDRSPGRMELLRGGVFKSRADSKPSGLIGCLHTISNDIRRGKEVSGVADRTFLDQLRASSIAQSSLSVDAGYGVGIPCFGVQHFISSVEYDVNGFVDSNIDAVDVTALSLLKASEDPFISNLLTTASLAREVHPKDNKETVAAQISDTPRTLPSRIVNLKGESVAFAGRSSGISPSLTQLNLFLSSLLAFLDQTHIWSVYCLRPNSESEASNVTDFRFIKHQVDAWSLQYMISRLATDYVTSYTFEEISLLLDKPPVPVEELRSMCKGYGLEEKTHFTMGQSRIFLSYSGFKQLNLHQGVPLALLGKHKNAPVGESSPPPPFQATSTSRRPSSSAAELIRAYRRYEDDERGRLSDSPDVPAHRQDTMATLVNDYQPRPSSDNHFGAQQSLYTLADGDSTDWKTHDKEDIEVDRESISNLMRKGTVKAIEEDEQGITKSRLIWLVIVWSLTWWLPIPLLMARKKYRRPDVRMAYREKVASCMLIFLLCSGIIFYIVFLGLIICPEYNKVWNPKELSYHQGKNDFYVAIRGEVYDISDFWTSQHSDISAEPVEKEDMLALAGQDLTNYFPIPLTRACPNLVTNENVALRYKTFSPIVSTAVHTSGALQPASNSELNSNNWYYDRLIPSLRKYHKGPLVYTRGNVSKTGSEDEDTKQRDWAFYRGRVYDLSDYFYTVSANPQAPMYKFLNDEVAAMFQGRAGQDVTEKLDSLNSLRAAEKQDNLECIKNLFMVGHHDTRELPRCLIQPYMLLAFSTLIVTVILVKFLAALQFGTKRVPEPRDKFVILQVPCYSEGEQSLRQTINSLSSLQYDSTRKLLFVVCDGQVVGAGNEKTTPAIVLDILGASASEDVDAAEPLLYHAIGEGAKQLNYGKVYSGLYEYQGQVLPYLVVVKVGKPSERHRPGNRGKRDSQILLMRWLNRVNSNGAMSPLELEMTHQVKNVIGVDPKAYSYLLCLDADTECAPDALNRLIAVAHDDTRIIGLCGETQITNQQSSWVSLIQNYEYWISHHMAKSFESLFSSVTCLPGCFTLYRLKDHETDKLLLISDKILDDYSQNNIDTLHKKNLFLLGEDRYLTTLLLKHFPEYKTKFTPEARAKTVVPDTWKVLLSQRRRWINSTVHNLIELLGADNLCGACCFSMRFVVLIDLIGTLMLPATFGYLVYLIVEVALHKAQVPIFSLILLGAVYGLQCILFLLKRQFQFVFWLLIYLAGYPLFSFVLPVYSFWHFDDVQWGKTRVVMGEGKKRKVLAALDEEVFDISMVPMRKFADYQASAWQEEQEQAQYADYPMADKSAMRASYAPSARSRSPSSTQLLRNSLPFVPPFSGSSPSHTRLTHTPFGSVSSMAHLPLAMPMPVLPYSPWVFSPGSTVGSQQGGSYFGPPSDHSRPVSATPGFMMGHRQTGSVGSQLSGFRADSPMMTPPDLLATPLRSSNPSDTELKEAVRMFLSTQDLMKVTKRSTREAIQRMFPKTDLGTKKEILNSAIDDYCAS